MSWGESPNRTQSCEKGHCQTRRNLSGALKKSYGFSRKRGGRGGAVRQSWGCEQRLRWEVPGAENIKELRFHGSGKGLPHILVVTVSWQNWNSQIRTAGSFLKTSEEEQRDNGAGRQSVHLCEGKYWGSVSWGEECPSPESGLCVFIFFTRKNQPLVGWLRLFKAFSGELVVVDNFTHCPVRLRPSSADNGISPVSLLLWTP